VEIATNKCFNSLSHYHSPVNKMNTITTSSFLIFCGDTVRSNWCFCVYWRFMEPLYSGTYPAVMVNRVGGRLPKFTRREYLMVKGSYDFIGLNYYTSTYATSSPCPRQRPTAFTDACVRFTSTSNSYILSN